MYVLQYFFFCTHPFNNSFQVIFLSFYIAHGSIHDLLGVRFSLLEREREKQRKLNITFVQSISFQFYGKNWK